MADFCLQCARALGFEGGGDFADTSLSTKTAYLAGYVRRVLCEGCGDTTVDPAGACVATECLENHPACSGTGRQKDLTSRSAGSGTGRQKDLTSRSAGGRQADVTDAPAASKAIPLTLPTALLILAERQRARDIARAEIELVRHKAREAIAPTFVITVTEGEPGYRDAVTWLQSIVAKPDKVYRPAWLQFVPMDDGTWTVRAVVNETNGVARQREVYRNDKLSPEEFFRHWPRGDAG